MEGSNETLCRCVVGGCKYNPETNGQQVPELDDTIKFYNFPLRTSKPGDKFQRTKWVEFVRISLGLDPKSLTGWTPSSGDKICSTHFMRNYKSENPSKSNYAPTIYPECIREVPPQITYDLRDLVCWWIKEGERNFSSLFPIVEAEKLDKPVEVAKPKAKLNEKSPEKKERELKSFTLVEVDASSEFHPFVKAYIRVEKDLTFRACMKNTPVPAHALLGESENVCVLGSVYEFQCALSRLVKLNPCNGTSTAGLMSYPKNMNGRVVKMQLEGKESERLVSNDCEIVAAIKVCDACKKLWHQAFSCRRQQQQKKMEQVEDETSISAEERLDKCARIIENYKAEVCKLMGKNKELKDKIRVFKEALKQESGQNIDGSGGGRKRTISCVDSDVEEMVEDVDGAGANRRRRMDLNDEDVGGMVVESLVNQPVSVVGNKKLESHSIQASTNSTLTQQISSSQINQRLVATPAAIQNSPQNPIPSTSQQKSTALMSQQKTTPSTSQQKPVQKVVKISREQAVLLRKLTSTSSSGNVIRVQASQLASINKILGRPNAPSTPAAVVGPSTTTNTPTALSTPEQKPPPPKTASALIQKPKIISTMPTNQQVIRVVDNRKIIEDGDKSSNESTEESASKKIFNVRILKK